MKNLSIIIPCYNSEKYLRRCLDTVVSQKLDDFEVICVNYASPDNGIEILYEYMKLFPDIVRIIDLKENVKQGGARNAGLRAAGGKYIGFVDSDDWISANMYGELYSIAEEKCADVVVCGSENTYVIDGKYFSEKKLARSKTVSGGDMDAQRRRKLLTQLSVGVYAKIYRRDFIVDNSIFFPEGLFMEDAFFTPLVNLIADSVYHYDKAMYYRLIHSESTVHKKDVSNNYDRLDIFPLLLQECKERGLYQEYKDEIDFNIIRHYYGVSLRIFFNSSDNVALDRLYEMRNFMRKNIPDYTENPYIGLIDNENKTIMKLLDFDPELAYEYTKYTSKKYNAFKRN